MSSHERNVVLHYQERQKLSSISKSREETLDNKRVRSINNDVSRSSMSFDVYNPLDNRHLSHPISVLKHLRVSKSSRIVWRQGIESPHSRGSYSHIHIIHGIGGIEGRKRYEIPSFMIDVSQSERVLFVSATYIRFHPNWYSALNRASNR